jgi:ABC-type transport system involved in multi-copper enzyme maturation permease subunit/predicted  nucleic acid-binding Zn-ribbon protein
VTVATNLLGILVLERDPPRFSDLSTQTILWLQDAGGFAAFALLIWLISALVQKSGIRVGREGKVTMPRPVMLLTIISLVIFGLGGFSMFAASASGAVPEGAQDWVSAILLAVGGGVAILGLALPFLQDVSKLRLRRIWAIAKLSWQEAIRRRVLWVYLLILIVFLFPTKWFFPIKPEDEIRTNVNVIYWVMTPLLLITATLLAAFSIPNDIRNQTIHTIVTKPVERFEILVGRFLGYMGLTTLVMLLLTGFSLVMLAASRVSPEAAEESFKARQVVYGILTFKGQSADFKGDSVGREWEYRRYIAGGPRSPQRAIWAFTDRDLKQLPLRDYDPIVKLEQQRKSLLEELAKARSRVSDAEKQAEPIRAEIAELESEVKELQEELASEQAAIDKQKQKIKGYEDKLAENPKQTKVKSNLEKAQAKLKSLEGRVAEIVAELAPMQRELAKKQNELDQILAGSSGTTDRAKLEAELAKSLAERQKLLEGKRGIPIEFSFDIFRTTKGEENKGVDASFRVMAWQFFTNPAAEQEYAAEFRNRPFRNAQPDDKEEWARADDLAYRYGIYEFRSKEVIDYHTLSIDVPKGVFRKALEGSPKDVRGPDGRPQPLPHLVVEVKCDSRTQFLGMARYDLYLLISDGNFSINFFKGMLGLWMRLCLVIGVALAISTYVNGIVAAIMTGFLFLSGLVQDLLVELSQSAREGAAATPGPAESLTRLLRGEGLTAPLDASSGAQVALLADEGFRWALRRLLNVIPDVDRLAFSHYVAEGFNVPTSELVLNFIFLIGYLLPWGLVAYHLLKNREIAA